MNCSLPGIQANIYQRVVDSPSNLHQYGVVVGIGKPLKNSSFWPSITHNETTVWSAYTCAGSNSQACLSSLDIGALSNTSSTWTDEASYTSLDNDLAQSNASLHTGRDSLTVWTETSGTKGEQIVSLQDFPLTLISNNTSKIDTLGSGGVLGLGSASTVLDQLYEQHLISSKSYGLYVGTDMPMAGGTKSGSLVLGGYDAAGFIGPVHTYPQISISAANESSPFRVRVAHMSLDTESGQSIDLTESGGFDAHLTTAQYSVQFPQRVTEMLAAGMSAKPTNRDERTLRVPDGFSGNLTITLDDGFKVVLDSTWLSKSSKTSPISAVPLQNAILGNTTTSSSNVPQLPVQLPVLLGASFLQEVYLLVSYDSSQPTFSLAHANKHSQAIQRRPLCPGTVPQQAPFPNIDRFKQQGMVGLLLGAALAILTLVQTSIFALKFKLIDWSSSKSREPDDVQQHRNCIQDRAKFESPKATYKRVAAPGAGPPVEKRVRFLSLRLSDFHVPPIDMEQLEEVQKDAQMSSDPMKPSTVTSAVETNTARNGGANRLSFTTNQRVLNSLDFGFGAIGTAQHAQQRYAPRAHPVPSRFGWRSSSIYSTD